MCELFRVNHNYTQACRYCFRLDRHYPKDLVHDVYLWYYKKTNKSLFELHNKEMISVIRSRWRTLSFRKMFMWDGVRYPKRYIEVGADVSPEAYTPVTTITPQDILIANDLKSNITNKLNEQENYLFGKLIEGYKVMEVPRLSGETGDMTKYRSRMLRNKVKTVL